MACKPCDRRDFLKAFGLGGTALYLEGCVREDKAPKEKSPNIVLVLTDDQGWGDIHSHGNAMLDTPVMDRLAESGARFDRFYVDPVCAPTRAGVLTGRYPMRTGVTGVTRGRENMRLDEVTIASVLKQAGYTTGCFGKWHNGAHYPYHPNGKGFDEFQGFCGGHWTNFFDTRLEHNGEPIRTKGFITDVLTDAALAFIEKNSNRPFFCYLPYNAPHSPFQVPQRYFDKYKARGAEDDLASVYGMVENLDDNLGRLLAKLDELKIADNTLVIFIGDNGPNTDRYNGGMRARKGSVHEGGLRVPCFVSWPGRIRPGLTVDRIAAHIDLLPTIIELAGAGSAETLPLDGVSLVPLLENHIAGWPDRMIFTGFRTNGSVRTQQYRMVVRQGETAELYDMTVDPGEQEDIAGERPEPAERLKQAYDIWYKEVTGSGLEVPPIPVGYRQRELVELPAHEARLEGAVKYKGGSGWAHDWVTGWTDTDSQVSWDLDVVNAGVYEITLMYTCPEDDIGAEVQVEAGGEIVEGTVQKAHDPEPLPSPDRVPRWEVYEKVWAPLTLGTVRLKTGKTSLAVRALSVPGGSAMDLKSVRVRLTD
ncbi:arylsulfatase [Gemmatimonadota bacterium]